MINNYQYLSKNECELLKKQVLEKLNGDPEYYRWGTLGELRDEELEKHPITHLSNGHLENILITQNHISNELRAAILMLLKKRYGVVS